MYITGSAHACTKTHGSSAHAHMDMRNACGAADLPNCEPCDLAVVDHMIISNSKCVVIYHCETYYRKALCRADAIAFSARAGGILNDASMCRVGVRAGVTE